jgi:squalene-associated FAD-dependent desaturase
LVSRPRVIVVGGGLAGLAAAVSCLDGGADVTLLERRPRLGGATWSFQRKGHWYDNGQHVFLRCCTSYLDFLDRIGAGHGVHLQDRLEVPVIRQGSPPVWLRRDKLPAPLHLARSLLRYRHLSIGERLRLGPAAVALQRLDPADPSLDAMSFEEWLVAHGQGPAAINALWNLITLPTVNLPASAASLSMAAMVFNTGVFAGGGAADLGWATIPLGELHGGHARRAIERAGGEVVTGTAVHSLAGTSRPTVVTADAVFEADAVVVAVPPAVADTLVPGTARPGRSFANLGASPIVNLGVVYDRRVTDLRLAAVLDSPIQWVFDRTEAAGVRRGQCLSVSLSAADAFVGQPTPALVELFLPALAELFPAARGAEVIDVVVTREPYATFRAEPGSASLRPGPLTDRPGVFLAGAWTDTGWPATMEGAVRSGRAAARHALASAGGRPPARPRRVGAES